ncbi:MAG TPA: YwiC-like family protein [Pyrinomonadaceae bacterium]|nr:YwiC-like family protein [Pyrinomonadaceae bacterium]
MPTNELTGPRYGVRLKSIALPAEHGGWGLLLEPVALGLMVAPSVAGLYLALAAVGFFVARHPAAWVIVNRRRSSPRTALAKRFALLYLTIGVASLIAAIVFARHQFMLPLAIAALFALVHLIHDWTGRRRALLPEIAGTVAISWVVAAIALGAGWSRPASFALWAIMSARTIPAIIYVRACLARMHRRPASLRPIMISHILAIVAAALWVSAGVAPYLTFAVMITLLVRAFVGFAKLDFLTPKQLGFSEIGFGAVTVFAVALGIAFHL